MSEFDLTAARAKRTNESKSLVMRDDDGAVLDKYPLVPEFPVEALDIAVEGKLGQAFRMLFEDSDQAAHFLKKYKPSVEDFNAVVRFAYGFDDVGEA